MSANQTRLHRIVCCSTGKKRGDQTNRLASLIQRAVRERDKRCWAQRPASCGPGSGAQGPAARHGSERLHEKHMAMFQPGLVEVVVVVVLRMLGASGAGTAGGRLTPHLAHSPPQSLPAAAQRKCLAPGSRAPAGMTIKVMLFPSIYQR
ncbi:unnamed protein product [Gadus morhua 'NCC']